MTEFMYYLLRHTKNLFLVRCINKLGNVLMPVYYKITPPNF